MLKRTGLSHICSVAKKMFLAAGLCFVLSTAAQAQEITAIDFNGDLLGKVIPDGKVVGFDNQLIGNVTADSLILNFDGRLIGGVVPQGIAIGNDARQLGKVSNDGSVRLPSGQVVGKVLPNGLVVNDYFDVIGAVLFPGLVYSDEGKTVGRVTGDGLYTNLQGQQIGLVTPDGYAYRRAGNDYVLDGRLISSKMVVSLNGEFIGSVNPGGTVSDFDSQNIGHIKANGYVYNDENQVIGKIVKSGYAFDNNGFYLGFVTYNGEVIDNEKLVGRLRADGNIVDENNRVIGYSLDISATATDFQGRYLGRLMPNGNLARAKELSGLIGARGIVLDASGNAVGQTVGTGPVFDFKGTLRGHALANGVVISLNGTPVGYMVHDTAYDLSGRIIGAVLQTMVIYALLTQILKGSINFRPQPLDIAKFFVLRYLIIIVSTVVFSALILWSRLHDLDLMTAVSAILGIPLTVYLLARLNIALPLFVSGEKISVKNVWQKTHQKPGAWLLAGMAVYFPGVLSEIFLSPFLPYLASAVNGAFLIISVIFSTVFYNKKFKNN